MSPHQFAALGIRFFVIWYVIFLIRELPLNFLYEIKKTGTVALPKVLVSTVAVLLVFALWFWASALARFLIVRSDSQTPTAWTESHVRTVGATLIGLGVIAFSLPAIVYYGSIWSFSHSDPMVMWQTEHLVSLLSSVIVFSIGIWMFLGASGLWQVWQRLRGRHES